MFDHMKLMKVLCIGNSNTGKTHFLKSIELRLKKSIHINESDSDCMSECNETKFNTKSEDEINREKYRKRAYSVDSTRGVDFFHKYFKINHKLIKIHFWDICGSERFRDVLKVYFCIGDCILYFFNVEDLQSLQDLKCWSEIIEKKWNMDVSDNYKIDKKSDEISKKDDRYKLVIGNVQNEDYRVVSYEKGYKFAKSLGCDYIEFDDTKLATHLICKKIVSNVNKKNMDYYIDTLELTLLNDDSESDGGSYKDKENENRISICNKITNKVLEYTNCCLDRGYIPIFTDDKTDVYELSLS